MTIAYQERLTFPSAVWRVGPAVFRHQCANGVPQSGIAIRLKRRDLFQSLKQYRDATLARLVGEQVAG
jgi:hypothetical protein